jgi:hypothetical protein
MHTIETVITQVYHEDSNTFDYWVTESERGTQCRLLGAWLGGPAPIASLMGRLIDQILAQNAGTSIGS